MRAKLSRWRSGGADGVTGHDPAGWSSHSRCSSAESGLLGGGLAALAAGGLCVEPWPPWFDLPEPVSDFSPPCLDAFGEFAISAARSLDMPLSLSASCLVLVLHVRRLRRHGSSSVRGVSGGRALAPVRRGPSSSDQRCLAPWPLRTALVASSVTNLLFVSAWRLRRPAYPARCASWPADWQSTVSSARRHFLMLRFAA